MGTNQILQWWVLCNIHVYWRLIMSSVLWALRSCVYLHMDMILFHFLFWLVILLSCIFFVFVIFCLQLPFLAEAKSRNSCLCTLFPTASLLCLVLFLGSAYVAPDYREVCCLALDDFLIQVLVVLSLNWVLFLFNFYFLLLFFFFGDKKLREGYIQMKRETA